MKKMIVPGVIGAIMFVLAFVGAFFVFPYFQERANNRVKEVAAQTVATLKQEGRVTLFAARLNAALTTAVSPSPAAEADNEEGAVHEAPPPSGNGRITIVPADVSYTLDLGALKPQDAKWDAEEQAINVTVPALTISEPVIVTPEGQAAPDVATQKAALGQLLLQARSDQTLGLARKAGRERIEHAFAAALKEEGIKAGVHVRFSDEPKPKADEEGDHEVEEE